MSQGNHVMAENHIPRKHSRLQACMRKRRQATTVMAMAMTVDAGCEYVN